MITSVLGGSTFMTQIDLLYNLKISANNNSLVLLMKLNEQCVWDSDRKAARNILS